MDGSSDYVSLIVFALLALVVVWKLYTILGTKTNERQKGPSIEFRSGDENPEGRVPPPNVRLLGTAGDTLSPPQSAPSNPAQNWSNYFEENGVAPQELDHLRMTDPRFEPAAFLDGAAKAYEIIIEAFASGDREALRGLLSNDVFHTFDGEVVRSEASGETRTTTIVALQAPKIARINCENGLLQITVRFNSELISATRNKDGAVINGNVDIPTEHTDLWTFSRSIQSPDPNWKLIATQS